jgi:hypothetical protein
MEVQVKKKVAKKTKLKLAPAFDAVTGTWFVSKPKVEAPTIREVLVKLRKRYPDTTFIVEDYYPKGAPRTRWPGTATTAVARLRPKLVTGALRGGNRRKPPTLPA